MDYRVEELAASAELSVDTVRYYQKLGLVEPPTRRGRVGIYDDAHKDRLDEIATLSAQGFTLAQIAKLVSAHGDGLLRALQGEEAVDLLDRRQLASRSRLGDDLVDLAIDAGLVRPATTTPELFGADAVEMLEAAATILDSGLPLDELIALAVEHAGHVENIVDGAIEMFQRHMPRGSDPAVEVSRLVPAVSDLVAQHFRHTLIERASRRLVDASATEETQS